MIKSFKHLSIRMGIKLKERKAQQIAKKSLWVSIPFEFVNYHNMKKGQIVEVELHENGEALILRPKKQEVKTND